LENRWKLNNARSGGIMLLVKDDFVKYVNIINTECKYVPWFKISKYMYLLNISKDVVCSVVYIPPESSKYSSPDCFWDIECDWTSTLNNYCFMVDFNAIVGHLRDYLLNKYNMQQLWRYSTARHCWEVIVIW
jgi:hypothetical protein